MPSGMPSAAPLGMWKFSTKWSGKWRVGLVAWQVGEQARWWCSECYSGRSRLSEKKQVLSSLQLMIIISTYQNIIISYLGTDTI